MNSHCGPCPACLDHRNCAGMLLGAFRELGWDVTVSTAPIVLNVWVVMDPFVCPHGVPHWVEPTGEQLAEKLRAQACPECGTTGSVKLGTRLRARPLGTWSLAGQQLKTSAVQIPVLECSVEGCGFVKLPSRE